MACPHAGSCDLSAAISNRVALLVWRRKCCDDERDFPACERFKLVESGRPIPAGLLPNGHRLALLPA
ncbi:MAG: hypothetical protein HZB56_22920 [Deltaproteobacteria bacterium]|nr:hypothetical protein [Deltaproteobacteria bacterium]